MEGASTAEYAETTEDFGQELRNLLDVVGVLGGEIFSRD
jgi:hypothetical protein